MLKERVTVTLTPELVARIDRLAELRDTSRSGMVEHLLELGVEEQERLMGQLASPILGPIVQGIMDHPKLVAAIAKAIGDRLSPQDIAQWQEAAPKVRKVRERLKSTRGRRTDLRPLEGEGA